MTRRSAFGFFVAVGCLTGPLSAVTLDVTTTTMAVADDGLCSLPEAIVAANTNTASGAMVGECPAGTSTDVIRLAENETYILDRVMSTTTIEGDNGLPIITGGFLILEGRGSKITRDLEAPDFRLLQVDGFNVVLRNIHFDRGWAEWNGGGVLARSLVTVEGATFTNNIAGAFGGGVSGTSNGSNLIVRDSSFSFNQGGSWGGGVYVGHLGRVENSHFFSNNVSSGGGSGAGVGGNGDELVVVGCTFTNNFAGAVQFGHGRLELRDSVIWTNHNQVPVFGDTRSHLKMVNTLVTDNTGYAAVRFVGTGEINNSTIFGNPTRGLMANSPASVTVSNSIVAQNSSLYPNCGGEFDSRGHNLDSDGSCGFDAVGDETADPQLTLAFGPLGEPWLIPSPGSPAVDTGSTALPGSPGACEATDVRGEIRPVDGGGSAEAVCDKGAFEAPHSLFADGFESGDMSAWRFEI